MASLFGRWMNGSHQVSIYTLSDPRNGKVRYVGMTKHPRTRMNEHSQMRQ